MELRPHLLQLSPIEVPLYGTSTLHSRLTVPGYDGLLAVTVMGGIWRVYGVDDEVCFVGVNEKPPPDALEPLAGELAAWRVDEWFDQQLGGCGLEARGILGEISDALGGPWNVGPAEAQDAAKARLREALREGRMRAFRMPKPLPKGDAAGDEPVPKSIQLKDTSHWIAIRLIDDVTGKPAQNVELVIKHADGEKVGVTNHFGIAKVRGLPAGQCTVAGECDHWRIEQTVCVGPANKPSYQSEHKCTDACSSLELTSEYVQGRRYRVLEIEEYQVVDGDTLDSIADGAGMTSEQLAMFNWGTREPEEIQLRMRDTVGCLYKDDETGLYVFDDDDDPGIVYLPKDWESQAYPVDQEHEIRVSLVPLVRPDLKYHYPLDVDNPSAQDDTIILVSADGTYRHVIEAKSLTEVEPDWVELIFPAPDRHKQYHLIQNPGDDGNPFFVWDDMPYRELYRDEPAYDEGFLD